MHSPLSMAAEHSDDVAALDAGGHRGGLWPGEEERLCGVHAARAECWAAASHRHAVSAGLQTVEQAIGRAFIMWLVVPTHT
jgi:hypothetical protein